MPSSPPRDSGFPDGGIFEMRTYQLQPGKLLEWEHAWKKGIDARQRFIVRRCRDVLTSETRRSVLCPGRQAARGAPPVAVPRHGGAQDHAPTGVDRRQLERHGAEDGQPDAGDEDEHHGADVVESAKVKKGQAAVADK